MFRDALLKLLEEKGGIEKISVRELCAEAELNRSTFYAHYSEPRDVLEETEEEILSETANDIRKIGAEKTGGGKGYLKSFLQYIKDNDRIFNVLLVTGAAPGFKNRFMQIALQNLFEHLQVEIRKEKQQYVYSYLIFGSLGIITQWVRSDYAASVDEIVEILLLMNSSALQRVAE